MSLRKSIPILLVIIVGICISCKKTFLKPDPTSDPERNFEIFWNDVNNGYPYMQEDNIDWKARYKIYRPRITSSTSTMQLYEYMTDMLEGFSDGHLSVQYGDEYYANEKIRPSVLNLVRQDELGTPLISNGSIGYYIDNYNRINKGYIEPSTYTVIRAGNGITPGSSDSVCIYGMMKNTNILYVNITTFLTDYSFANLLQNIFSSYPLAQGLILDLRWNGGGNLGLMAEAMSVFAPRNASQVKYAYVREKVGPAPESFGEEKYFAVFGNATSNKFAKPIVVLTNRLTISAAEHATMALREMKQYNNKIKIIGDYTFGATSFVVQRTLPCGIQYTLVNSKTWDINHIIVERTGVKPDKFVYITEQMIYMDRDNQIEDAIDIIQNDRF